MLFSIAGKTPKVHPTAFVAPNAVIIGDVTIEAYASVWFNSVLRGDAGEIVIGERTNVQDGAVLHDHTIVGKGCVLAHMTLTHDAEVGDNVLIGNHAAVIQGAKIGEGAIIAAGAVLLGPVEVPPRTLWLGIPAKQAREVNERLYEMTKRLALDYQDNRGRYLEGLEPADELAKKFWPPLRGV